MIKMRAAERFLDKTGSISSPKLQARLNSLLDLISEVPTVGSVLNRDYLREEYGQNCLTLDLSPFLIVYEYDEASNTVDFYDIIHQRSLK